MNNYIDYFFYGAPLYSPTDNMSATNKDDDDSTASIQKKNSTAHVPSRRVLQDVSKASERQNIAFQQDHLFSSSLKNHHRWISLIPNSFVITHPYPRSDPEQ